MGTSCAVPSGSAWNRRFLSETAQLLASLYLYGNVHEETTMPALLVPVLIGIPVLFVGGYYLVQVIR
jgi:hypothetical protein